MENERNVTIGNYLKNKRVKAGLTQFDIAQKLGYSSAQYISNIERGCCFPATHVLRGMVKHYKIPSNEILRILVDIDTKHWKKKLAIKGN